jgi:hypothetical protein
VADPKYDGLCGIPSRFTTRDGLYLRCTFEFGHGGDKHSWEKLEPCFHLFGGITLAEAWERLYAVPEGCTCAVRRAEDGSIVEYIFSPDCPAHTPKESSWE